MKKILIFIILASLLFLSSCNQCKKSSDCPTQANKEANCAEYKCIYTDKTISTTQKNEFVSEQIISRGDRFNLMAEFPQPFDPNKDIIKSSVSLISEQKGISDRKILGIQLYDAKDKRFISSSEINKYLWTTGKDFELTTDLVLINSQNLISDPELIVNYEYKELNQPKQAELKLKFKKQLRLQKLKDKYSCPQTCPEKQGYRSYCDEKTNFFCTYNIKQDACGNGICDVNENKCSCAIDCSPCKGSLKFLDFNCVNDNCITRLKPAVNILSYDVRQDKQGIVDFEIHYKFNNPFNTNKDNLTIEITPKFDQDVSDLKIEDIILTTTGNIQLASAKDQRKAPLRFRRSNDKLTTNLIIPKQSSPEEEKTLNIDISLSYKKNNNDFSEKITKNLQTPEVSKITLVSAT